LVNKTQIVAKRLHPECPNQWGCDLANLSDIKDVDSPGRALDVRQYLETAGNFLARPGLFAEE
jgi:hypothetical protein